MGTSVTRMIGTGLLALIFRATSTPLIPGISWSRITRSKKTAAKKPSACSPLEALSTSYPAAFRIFCREKRVSGSSPTDKISLIPFCEASRPELESSGGRFMSFTKRRKWGDDSARGLRLSIRYLIFNTCIDRLVVSVRSWPPVLST